MEDNCKFITLEDGAVIDDGFDSFEEVSFEADTSYAYHHECTYDDICCRSYKVELIKPVRAKISKPVRAVRISVGNFAHLEFEVGRRDCRVEVDKHGSAIIYADQLESVDVSGALVMPRTTKLQELYIREGGILIAPSLAEIEILVGGDVVGALFAPIYQQEPVSDRFLPAEEVAQNKFARELGCGSWDELMKFQAGRWAAARNGFGVEAPTPEKEYAGGRVVRFPDGSVFVAEPRKVYLNWQVFLLKHGKPAS